MATFCVVVGLHGVGQHCLTFYSGIHSFNIVLNSCHIPVDDPDHVALFSTEFGVAVWNI